jgi:hypothetical protein
MLHDASNIRRYCKVFEWQLTEITRPITDIGLPDRSGDELAAEVRAIHRSFRLFLRQVAWSSHLRPHWEIAHE